ncbi:hypothetical protein Ddye_017858 [Dipteronia dyeriana]|uniref:RNase H type-1 domain-containing protein n=1 Tax=Dipteronia dyeriana TaxID=168575 RepID=A0AAD9X077_9ROSI|nr:hypothetical protein Ddye_017858 [Dipteronia dyeriana]
MAILRGIRFIIDAELLPAVIESDAKVVVDLVNVGVASSADIGLVVNDILSLLICFPISISFVPRSANSFAHSLAKLVVSSVEDLFWLESVLPCMEALVLTDRSR